MKKKTIIISLLLALVAMVGQSQIVCHVEGELMTDNYGNDVVICEVGTNLDVHDNPSLHVMAVNGKFSKTIECDHVTKYVAFLFENEVLEATFYAENGTVRLKLYDDQDNVVESDGEEWLKKQALDNLLEEQFGDLNALNNLLYDKEHESEFYTTDFLASTAKIDQELQEEYSKNDHRNQTRIDSMIIPTDLHLKDLS